MSSLRRTLFFNLHRYLLMSFVISRALILISFLCVFVLSQSAAALPSGQWREHADAEQRVILYEHPNYAGHTLPLYGADGIADLHDKDRGATGDWNDRISSVEFAGSFRVTFYSEADFQGPSVSITSSRSTLYDLSGLNWNDTISSIRWEPISAVETKAQAIFYENVNFGGRSFTLYPSDTIKDLRTKKRGTPVKTFNDQIRSVRIFGRGTTVQLFEDRNFAGSRTGLSKSNGNLGTINFSRKASSVKVYIPTR